MCAILVRSAPRVSLGTAPSRPLLASFQSVLDATTGCLERAESFGVTGGPPGTNWPLRSAVRASWRCLFRFAS